VITILYVSFFFSNGEVKFSILHRGSTNRPNWREVSASLLEEKENAMNRAHVNSTTRHNTAFLAPRRISRRALLFIPSRHACRSLESARTHTANMASGASCIAYCRILQNLYASRFPLFREISSHLRKVHASQWRIGEFIADEQILYHWSKSI